VKIRLAYILGIVLFAAATALLCFCHIRFAPYAADDSFIHLRIAQNYIQYGVPFFNPDTAINSSSSTVWTLILSLLESLKLCSLVNIALLNAAFLSIAAAVWGFIAYHSTSRNKILIAILSGLAVVAVGFDASAQLMEASLALLLLGCATTLLSHSPFLAGLFLSLAVFTRYELAFYLVSLGLLYLCLEGTKIFKFLAGAFSSAAPLCTWHWLYFGTLLPHTMQAKRLVYSPTSNEFLQILARSMLGHWSHLPFRLLIGSYVVAILLLLLILIWRPPKLNLGSVLKYSDGRLVALAISALAILICYYSSRVLIFPWYMPLFISPLLITIICILWPTGSWTARLLSIILVAPFTLRLIFDCIAATGPLEEYSNYAAGCRVRKYVSAGEKLYQNCPNCTLMAPEIGGLGYSFKGHILDTAGLASPSALRYHPMPIPEERASGMIGAVPTAFIEATKPDIIVSMDLFIEDFLKSPWQNNYHHLEETTVLNHSPNKSSGARLWQESRLHIFVRRDGRYPQNFDLK
jgi:hypothetical protein